MRRKNSRVAALATFAVWVGAFLWQGVPGLVCAVVGGLVMATGTLVNAGAFANAREPELSRAMRRYGEAVSRR